MIVGDLEKIYFETSAVNYLFDNHTLDDAIKTKEFQNQNGKGWYISSVVLWEILLTNNEVKREKLIYFAQHLFESHLLPSPEELIVSYMENGHLPINMSDSQSTFAESWHDICNIKEKTLFPVSRQEFGRQNDILRQVSKITSDFLKGENLKFYDLDIPINQSIMQGLLDDFHLIPVHLRNNHNAKLHYQLVMLYILLILCLELSLESGIIQNFWEKKKIDSIYDRMLYIFTNHPKLVTQGVFQPITFMTNYQAEYKSRGLYFDSLHTLYTMCSDCVISADEHFRILRTRLEEEHHFCPNIIHIDEVEWAYYQKKEGVFHKVTEK